MAAANQAVTVYGCVVTLSEFGTGDDWELYQERLEQYFDANLIPDGRKVSVLLTLIGAETYKVLRDSCDPVKPKDKTFNELGEILKKQFSPRVSVLKERVDFYELKQRLHESISDWYARVKNKAISCKFGEQLDNCVRDRFVTGMCRGRILDRVCEEEHTATIATLYDVALKKEAAMSTATTVPVNRVDARSAA